MSLLVLFNNTNFYLKIQTSRTNLNSIKKLKLKQKNNSLTNHIFYNLQNHPIFHSAKRLINFVRGRECFIGLSILLVDMPTV